MLMETLRIGFVLLRIFAKQVRWYHRPVACATIDAAAALDRVAGVVLG
jgi:hypothetical protein